MSSSNSTYVATSGEAYHRFLGRWTGDLAAALADFAAPQLDGPLLDAGCGSGSLARVLAARASDRDVTGIDIAEPYVAHARSLGGGPRLTYATASATALPFANDTFAAAYAQLVVNFIPKPLLAVREMIRVTKPGGVIAAAIWDFRGGLVYQRIFWDTAAGVEAGAGAARDRHFSTPLAKLDPLVALWQEAGLADIEVASLPSRMNYASFADYWEPLTGGQGPVGAYIDALAPEMLKRIRDAVHRAYLSGDEDGPRSMTATAWAVSGIKA